MAGETQVLGENLPQCRFLNQISHDLTWDCTRDAGVESRKRQKESNVGPNDDFY
jgi:hypothetical protein